MAMTKAQEAFVAWIKTALPQAYALAMREPLTLNEDGGGGFWDTLINTASNVATSALNTAKDYAPAYLQALAAKKILDMNIARAKQGLPPMTQAEQAAIIPALQAQVGVNDSTQKTILLVAAIIAGAFVLSRVVKR